MAPATLAVLSWSSWLNDFGRRHDNVLQQVLSAVPAEVTFRVLAKSGQTLSGEGWINVQQIRHLETDTALAVSWQGWTTWEVTLPDGVTAGTLGAYNSLGQPVASSAETSETGMKKSRAATKRKKIRPAPNSAIMGKAAGPAITETFIITNMNTPSTRAFAAWLFLVTVSLLFFSRAQTESNA